MDSPETMYRRHWRENQIRLTAEQQRDRWLGYSKVVFGLATLVAGVLLLHSPQLYGWLLLPLAALVITAVFHERVLRSVREGERRLDFYIRGLARLDNRWQGSGEPGERFMNAAHPCARDLDLFGKGSLFELLCTARTRAGEETLAAWLLRPAAVEEIAARQAAVAELTEMLNLRETLFVMGESVRLGVHPEALASWGEKRPLFHAGWLRLLTGLLSAAWMILAIWTFASWVHYAMSGMPPLSYWPVLVLAAVNFGISHFLQHAAEESALGTEAATADLDLLGQVLEAMERPEFRSSRLRGLQQTLSSGGLPASRAVKKLHRIVQWVEARDNLMVRAIDRLVFYEAQCGFAVEQWRERFGPCIRGWLDAVGAMEALAALSGYRYEHPESVWPEVGEGAALFDAEGLGHPLLPASVAVRNDLRLGDGERLMLVSGPNMAGKSTFLRAAGMNAVLAQCGAPVQATRLRMSRLTVGASICILDSLEGGVSRFYAEIQRLKLLSELASGPPPLLFLLDELLSGTNSHDRFVGTRYVVQALLRRGAIGLVTTHDLALARIAEEMPEAINCHFADHLEDGRLRFDFRLQPGVVQTSNALTLMKSIGLEVSE